MTTQLWCLLGFAGWTLLLVGAIGVVRVHLVLAGRARPNTFPSGERHGSDRYWRLNRAHANCLENLPLFAVVVLVGAVIGADHPRLGFLAQVILLARVAQSTVHVASGSELAVNARFGFFAVQLVALVWMALVTVRSPAL